MPIQHDLQRGKEGESLVCELFGQHGFTWQESTTFERLYWDLKLIHSEIVFTAEVKNDIMAAKTGNIAIEYFNSKKQESSGIDVTKADMWVHIIGGQIFAIATANLKDFIKNHSP